jgi:hypothetical protein
MGMRRVKWKGDGLRLYFTPVTVVGDTALVGRPVPAIGRCEIRDPVIVERTLRQVLTFDWPDGAAKVLAFLGQPGQDSAAAMRGQPEEITNQQYERQGGLYFRRELPHRGCSVHAFPVVYSDRRQILGTPVVIEYPGMLRLRYTVTPRQDRHGAVNTVTVQILSQYDDASSVYQQLTGERAPHFILVHSADRLPLHPHDGAPVHLVPVGDANAAAGTFVRPSGLNTSSDAAWTASVTGLVGYLRLFVVVPPGLGGRVALLDPPVAGLRLLAGRPSRGRR